MICPLCRNSTKALGVKPCLEDFETGLYYCYGCGSMFREPMPTVDQLQKYYSRFKFDISNLIFLRRVKKCEGQVKYIEGVLHEFKINKNTHILDLGAGIGILVYLLRQRGFSSVVGVEPRETAIDYAKQKLGVDLVKGYCEDAHLHANQDSSVLLMSHVLEHMPNPVYFMQYLKRYFSKSYLWIEVPDGNYESSEFNGVVAWQMGLDQHLWSFTEKGLCSLLQGLDFKILKAEHAVNYSFMARRRKLYLSLMLERLEFPKNLNNVTKLEIFVKKTELFIGEVYHRYLFFREQKLFNSEKIYIPDNPCVMRLFVQIP